MREASEKSETTVATPATPQPAYVLEPAARFGMRDAVMARVAALNPEPDAPVRRLVPVVADAANPEAGNRRLSDGVVPVVADKSQAGPPWAPTAAADPCPRTVHQNDRAPAGRKRFKVYSRTYPTPKLYVLATDLAQAEEHYLDVTRLAAALADAAAAYGDDVMPADLVVNELPD